MTAAAVQKIPPRVVLITLAACAPNVLHDDEINHLQQRATEHSTTSYMPPESIK